MPGAVVDTYRTNPGISGYPLEAVAVPTLVVPAVDDPPASYDAASRAAARIPGARVVSLDSGGHLQLGQEERVRAEWPRSWRRSPGCQPPLGPSTP